MMTTDTRSKPAGRCAPAECCDDSPCTCGLRNNFFEGKRLTPDMFRIEQRYAVERRRLLNRAIHGWGVVYGYGIESIEAHRQVGVERKLVLNSGLALDARGRELLQVAKHELSFTDVIVVDDQQRPLKPKDRQETLAALLKKSPDSICWLLSVHYAEQPAGHVTIPDSCHCDHDEWDHTCETVRYSLQQINCKKCCEASECGLDCECSSGRCCGDADPGHAKHTLRDPHKTHGRGGCRCLCDHLTQLDPGSDCDDRLCEVEGRCGHACVDLANGVPLACLTIVPDDCGDWTFGDKVEPCGPRRLVKRNDLLFDLIRGCDLTRIRKISWEDWHRGQLVPFERFAEYFGSKIANGDYLTNFYVTFSRPVRLDTLRPDCFVMTIITPERDDAWWEELRVPIVALDTGDIPADANAPPVPDGHVRGARLVVSGDWYRGVFNGYTRVFEVETRVEIEVRGDFIVDCNGQTVDANANGRSATVFGNGTPGGTFLSAFGVERQQPSARPDPKASDRKGVSS
jgi:hypothetical protein